ncbi:hypothetical protein ACX0HA_03055 [Flavobacterium hauense]
MNLKQLTSLKFLLLIISLFAGYYLFEKAAKNLYSKEALFFGLYILFVSILVNIINDKIDRIKKETNNKSNSF